jgi:hypothetical protein
VVVTEGDTLAAVPLVSAPTPLLTLPVPPLNTPVSVVEFPTVIVDNAGVKLVIAGAATTATVAVNVAVAGGVAELVTVSV